MKQSAPPWPAAGVAALIVIAIAAGLALLYLARSVLVPVTLAMVLSFATAPIVRASRRIGLGHGTSVFAVVLSIAAVVCWLVGLIGTHAVRIAEPGACARRRAERGASSARCRAIPPRSWRAHAGS